MTAAYLCSWLISLPAFGAVDSVRVVTIEGESIETVFAGVDTSGAILLGNGQARRAVPSNDLMRLRWSEAKATKVSAKYPSLIYLSDGSRLHARIVGGDTRSLRVETGTNGSTKIPLGRLAGILFATRRDADAREPFLAAMNKRDPSQDTLFVLREGKLAALRGVTESLSADGGSFRWRNRSVPIHKDNVYGLVFAAGVQDKTPAPARCVLRNGSIWSGRIVAGDAEKLLLERTDGTRITLPVADLMEIRFHSDRVVFLSELEPASYEFEPFATTRWPYRQDRSVANRPLRIGDRTFDRGIGMHSQATLVYDLDGRYSRFAAVIGIDEAVGPLGNVVFRVVADGKEVFSSGPVTGRDDPRTILVPLDGAKQIKLIVDFGEELDIGDQANWGNARLIQ